MSNKESVSLRRRALKNGNVSLYLDIYRNGKRDYEYLKLYLVPEKDKQSRQRNKETLALAEAIRAKRVVEVVNNEYEFRTVQKHVLFYDYFVALCEKKRGKLEDREGRGNWGNWMSCLRHLEIYDKHLKKRTLEEITNKYVLGFRDYLLNADAWSADYRKRIVDHKLNTLTARVYFCKLCSCVRTAIDNGFIHPSVLANVEAIKVEENERNYLTIDEVKRLANTDCCCPLIKRAFLFSCLTGLRRGDVINLKWKDVSKQGDYTRIVFKQQKTGGQEYIDISPQAAELLGEQGNPDDKIFAGLYSPGSTNRCIQTWCYNAGIGKKITFHCARHTFAVMMLDLGTDIYTVSKLLGHRAVATTQIYAKVLDKNKQAAVSRIPNIFDNNVIENL